MPVDMQLLLDKLKEMRETYEDAHRSYKVTIYSVTFIGKRGTG
jgi:hypothetical protein